LESSGFFTKLDHPYAGRLPYANAPFQFSETPSEMARPPLLGEHNEEILCGLLGYSKRALTQLRERGVI